MASRDRGREPLTNKPARWRCPRLGPGSDSGASVGALVPSCPPARGGSAPRVDDGWVALWCSTRCPRRSCRQRFRSRPGRGRCTVRSEQLDAVEALAECVGGEVEPAVGWASVAMTEVAAVVTHDEDVAADRGGGGEGRENVGAILRGRVHVAHQDQVEGARFGAVVAQVGQYPFHGQAFGACGASRPVQGYGGEVDGGERPSAPGQPKGLPALARAEVECPPGTGPTAKFLEVWVRFSRPERALAPVAGVPCVRVCDGRLLRAAARGPVTAVVSPGWRGASTGSCSQSFCWAGKCRCPR